ncbi:MAG: sensor histidine kinase [Pseudomonadota bacterium]
MNSLERRLQLGISLSLVLLIGLLWAAGNHSIRKLTEDFVTSRLEHDAESLLAALVLDSDRADVHLRRIHQIYTQPLSGHYYAILLDNGVELFSRSLWDQSMIIPKLAPGESTRMRITGPSGQQLLLWAKGYHKQNHRISIAVAEDLSSIQEQRDQFMRTFALLAVSGLVILLAIQSILVRRSFRRLEPVREDIRRLEQGKTDKLSENVPAEILPLVQELNHLLGLLAQRLERSRNALGNLAHALKGPLNILVHFFDSRENSEGDNLECNQARAQVERVRQLMDRELKRARLVGGGIKSQRFDPQVELPDLIRALKQVHRNHPVEIQYQLDTDSPTFGDREDMLELLGNLLDNACKWASSRVDFHLTGRRNIRIFVEDDGRGLSDRDLDLLTQRGVRLDETVEGHGLGLAIAKDIVKLYGGNIAFGRSKELGGLKVSITLPPIEGTSS